MKKQKIIINCLTDSARKEWLREIIESYIPKMDKRHKWHCKKINDEIHKIFIQKLLLDVREDLKDVDVNDLYVSNYGVYDKQNFGINNYSLMYFPKMIFAPVRISISKVKNDKTKQRAVIPEDTWRMVKNKFNNKCFKCGSNKNLHIDHHVPKSKGGADDIKNYVLLCAKCNGLSGKGVKTPEEFYTELELKKLKEEYGIN